MPKKRRGLVLPGELVSVVLRFRLPRKFADMSGMVARFGEFAGTDKRRDGLGVRGSLGPDSARQRYHGHFQLEQNAKGKPIEGYVALYRGALGGSNASRLTLTSVLSVFRAALSEQKVSGFLSSKFELRHAEWSPIVPLPFLPPGLLDSIPGAPQIAGVDFEFARPARPEGILRASLNTFEGLGHFGLVVISTHETGFEDELWTKLVERSSERMRVFVRQKEQPENAPAK